MTPRSLMGWILAYDTETKLQEQGLSTRQFCFFADDRSRTEILRRRGTKVEAAA